MSSRIVGSSSTASTCLSAIDILRMKPPLDRSSACATLADAEHSLKKRARKSNFQGVSLKRLRECWSVRRPGGASVRRRILLALCLLVTTSVALRSQPTIDFRDASSIPPGEEPIAPIPREVPLDPDKVRLGEM